jgi:hypothetical protein
MTTLALVSPDGTVIREADGAAIDPGAGLKNGFAWLPVVEVRPDTFDPVTQIVEGPVDSIGKAQVTRTWTARAKTSAELAADKDARISQIDALQLAVMFDHENRVRALEGKAALSAAQFRAALKARV